MTGQDATSAPSGAKTETVVAVRRPRRREESEQSSTPCQDSGGAGGANPGLCATGTARNTWTPPRRVPETVPCGVVNSGARESVMRTTLGPRLPLRA